MPGYPFDKDDHLNRLRRIEGQIRGLQRLVGEDTDCIDILTQIASVDAALKKVALGLVDEYLRHCGFDADPDEGERSLTEATVAVGRLLQL